MWRNASAAPEIFYLLRSPDGGPAFGKPEKLGQGTWMLNACPMDGGGLAHADGRTITAWRRDLEIFLAEPGKPETPHRRRERRCPRGEPGRTYALWVQGSQLVSWVDGKTGNVGRQGCRARRCGSSRRRSACGLGRERRNCRAALTLIEAKPRAPEPTDKMQYAEP